MPTPRYSRRYRRSRRFWRIIVVTVMLGIMGAAGLGLRKLLDERRGHQLVAWGDDAMSQGKYEDAAGNYGRALAKYPKDVDLADKLGDAFYQASAARPKALYEARAAWQQAMTINPDHLPTLKRLLALDADFAEIEPSTAAFADLGQLAANVARLAPTDPQALTLKAIAPLGAWATGTSRANDIASASVRDSGIAQLSATLDGNPTDGTALYYFVLASARRASELRETEATTADQLESQAKTRLRTALQSPQANSTSLLRTAQGFIVLAQSQPPTTGPAATQPAIATATIELIRDARTAIDKAAQADNPKDPYFVRIRLVQSRTDLTLDDRPAAEAALRDAIARRPDAISAKIALAELIKASDVEAAIKLLDNAGSTPCLDPGPMALVFESAKAQALALEAGLCVTAASTTEDANARSTAIARAQAACDRALADSSSNPAVLKALARLRFLQGEYLETIRTADLAINNAGPSAGVDTDLCYTKACAFWALHEPQEAMGELDSALNVNGSLVSHRLLRARILLAEGKTNEAAVQADLLRQEAGDDPQVIEFSLSVAQAQNKADPSPQRLAEMNRAYDRLPETTDAQRRQKATDAVAIANYKDAIRLLQATHDSESQSVHAAVDLADVLAADHQNDLANAVLDDALRRFPQDSHLLYARKQISGASPGELKAYEAELSQRQDPFTQDLQAARTALAQRNIAQARQALDKAASVKPDDLDVLDVAFRCDLLDGQWDAAKGCIDKLASANHDQMNGLSYQFQLAFARGDVATSVSIASTLTSKFDKFSGSWASLGLALQAGGRPREAIDAFQHACYLEPGNLMALKGAAQCCLATGKQTEAESWIQQGRKIAPDDPDFANLEARRILDQINSEAKASPPQWDQVEQTLAQGRAELPDDPAWDATEARMWWARGDAVKSSSLMHQAVLSGEGRESTARAPESAKVLRTLIREELSMLVATKDEAAVTRESRRIIDRHGNADIASAWAHLTLAIQSHRLNTAGDEFSTELSTALAIAERAGDVSAGIELLSTISKELGPVEALGRISGYGSSSSVTSSAYDRDVRWDILRAGLLEQRGDVTAAAAVVDRLMAGITTLPSDQQVSLLRIAGGIYCRLSPVPQTEKAIHAYEALLALAPEDVESLNNVAWLLLEQATPPQPQQAVAYSRRAYDVMLRDRGFDPQIADTHGWALANTGQFSDAIDLLEKVVQQRPSPETQDHLGEACLLAGKPAEAKPHLEAALELLRAAEQNGQPNPALRARLEAAQHRAAEMKPAPGGAN